jgi:hypothetical protein
MAIDFDAIRRKVAELSGDGARGASNFWKPDVGTHTVRLLPFKDNDGQPFKERFYHYGLGSRGFISLRHLGQNDPIEELQGKLYDEGSPGSRELAKKLYPKMRAYCPVVVRDNEDGGAQLWSFSKMIYQQLLNIMLDPDYGDITDPLEGRDIKITVIKKDGFKYPMVDSVMPRGKASNLNDDSGAAKQWLDSVPDLDDILKNDLKTYEEVEKIVNDWINGGAPNDSIGTTRFETSTSTGTSTSDTTTETTETTTEKKSGYTDLDAAFEDLLS